MSGTEDGRQPSGVVSLLFTDVEGSTRLWAADTDALLLGSPLIAGFDVRMRVQSALLRL